MTATSTQSNPYAPAVQEVNKHLDARRSAQAAFAGFLAEIEASYADVRAYDERLCERAHHLLEKLHAPVDFTVVEVGVYDVPFESNGQLPHRPANRITQLDTGGLEEDTDNEIAAKELLAEISRACYDKKGVTAIQAASAVLGGSARSKKDLIQVSKSKSFELAIGESEFLRAVFEAAGVALPESR